MQFPVIVVGYGDFATTKKLFSYELSGVHTMPLFTDAAKAALFSDSLSGILKSDIRTQICTKPEDALKLLQTIRAYCPDLSRVVIDPKPPVRNDDNIVDEFSLIENFYDLDDIIERVQGLVQPV